jgi:hypothetical protein
LELTGTEAPFHISLPKPIVRHLTGPKTPLFPVAPPIFPVKFSFGEGFKTVGQCRMGWFSRWKIPGDAEKGLVKFSQSVDVKKRCRCIFFYNKGRAAAEKNFAKTL